MSGHSKWSTIKRKKGVADAKRGKIFTKLVREITTAVRMGGPDPDGNPRLRLAIEAARAARMPADNIERGIKKGSGELAGGVAPEDIVYEGYAVGGVAVVVEAQTDNRNRTSAEIRSAFAKAGGSLGASGSVGWMFHKKGQIVYDLGCAGENADENTLTEAAIDAGAEDVERNDDLLMLVCAPQDFLHAVDHMVAAGFTHESAELTRIPENWAAVDAGQAESIVRLVDRLEDLDDVQKVFTNMDAADEVLEALA